jgi:prepilin-type N-terminal cleavage/methylation domain-containing protein
MEPDGDRGVTLVELLVVVAITGIVLPLAFAVLLSVQRQTKATVQFSDDVGQARLAMQSVDRLVRSANQPLSVSLSGAALGLLTTAQPGYLDVARCVQFKVLNGALLARNFQPGATPPAWPAGSLARRLNPATVTFTASSAAQVVVRFDVLDSTGRSTRIESALTARNVAGSGGTTVDPATCVVIS